MEHDSPAVRKRRTAEERREEVLAAAIIEFAAHGLYGASTEVIAERAGISQPYVLRLFKTKKSLFLAAVEHVTGQIMRSWGTALAGVDGSVPPHLRLQMLGERYAGFVGEVNALRLVLQSFSSAEDPEVRALSHRCLKMMHAWVAEKSGAEPIAIQQFFAYGMMLTVAASIRAGEAAETEDWARMFVQVPMSQS
jgi:AcrR family transcriptional regulator